MGQKLGIFALLLIIAVYSTRGYRRFGHHAKISVRSGWWFWKEEYFFSGAIIAENWIVTVSECYRENFKITVYIGSDYFNEGFEREGLEFVRNENIQIALIRTEEIIFSDLHRYLPLPNNDYPNSRFVGERGYFPRWTTIGGILTSVEITILESKNCSQAYGNFLCGCFPSTEMVILHGFVYRQKYITYPGSPLAYRSPDGPLLIGLLHETRSGIGNFVSLSYLPHIEWIESITQLSLKLTCYS